MLSQIFLAFAEHGVPLSDQGIAEAALPLEVALAILTDFAHADLVIMGGDIYRRVERRLEPAVANWSYNGENSGESVATARTYLERLTSPDLFVVYVPRCANTVPIFGLPAKPMSEE